MSKRKTNDISVGKDEWIEFIDIDGRQECAASPDVLMAPLETFWTALETNCVADCCGFDAFSLWPESIRKAGSTVDRESLMHRLAALQQFVERHEADVFVSQRLNNYFDRQVLLQIIDHIQKHAILS